MTRQLARKVAGVAVEIVAMLMFLGGIVFSWTEPPWLRPGLWLSASLMMVGGLILISVGIILLEG